MPESGPSNDRLAELRRRFDDDPQSAVFLQLAEEYRRQGHSEQALKLLEEGLKRNPGYVSAQVAQARCLLDLGRASLSVPVLDQILGKDPSHLVARKLLVEALVRQVHAVRARRELDLYTSLNPADPDIEGLRLRIDDLQLAELVPPKRLVATPEEMSPSVAARLVRPAVAADAEPSLNGMSGMSGEPFAGLPSPPALTRLRAIAADGIFAWPGLEEEPEQPAFPPIDLAPEHAEEETLAPPPPAPTSVATTEPSPTATLGHLYLLQGHRGEAEKIFREVLAVDAENAQAREGLETLRRLAEPVAEATPEPTPIEMPADTELAAELTGGVPQSIAAKKALRLRGYLRGLRQAARNHVS